MDLMKRRRELLVIQKHVGLYPVGTDIIAKYYGHDDNGFFIGEANCAINTQGEWIKGTYYGNPTFIPVNPEYRYRKSAARMYSVTFYNADYECVSTPIHYNNLKVMEITNIPSNARYMRFVSHPSANTNWKIQLTRIE